MVLLMSPLHSVGHKNENEVQNDFSQSYDATDARICVML